MTVAGVNDSHIGFNCMVTINNTKIADLGFYINLDKRTDRNARLLENLSNYNISGVERFSAFNHTSTPQYNLILSTFAIYKKFLESSAETLLILEDDCEFLPPLNEYFVNIFNDIHSTEWDVFWLGCVNRKHPKFYKNNCYQVSSPSYAQSYIIKRKMCEDILHYFENDWNNLNPDELLCLFAYGYEIAKDPNQFNFYQTEQPLDVFPVKYISLCHTFPLTTQYNSYSDLWGHVTNLEDWIPKHHPDVMPTWLN